MKRASRHTALRRLATVAVVAALVALVWALFQPFAGDGGDRVRVVVPSGAGVGEIADVLDRSGVIESTALFELRATIEGKRSSLRSGVYYLREGMSYGDVLDRLSAGPALDVVQVVIPEGLSRKEIAPIARRAGLRGDYAAAAADVSLLDRRALGIDESPDTLEGFLFPATYELKRGATVRELVTKQLATFEQRLRDVDLSYAREKNLTIFDVVKIASMVEREAQLDRERPLVAAVIYNRLREGQPLGIDATIRYATGNWQSPLTRSQLALDSPYNTRTKAGLPPGPIGNPGLESLRSAARPARVDYLFYVVKPGTCGEHAFSSTEEEFSRDRRRYEEARAAAGDRSPTNCP